MRYGIFISFKKICCCRVDDRDRLYCFLNMDNSIVASFLFGLGLFTIINLELNLFTGKIGYICKENCAETLITLVGNGIGVNIMAFLMKQTRVGVRLVEKAGPIVETKLSDTYISLFCWLFVVEC